MRITIDSSEPLEDAIRVIGAMYNVTLTTGSGEATAEAPAQPAAESTSRRNGQRRASRTRSTNRRRRARTPLAKVSNAELRSWARENGHTVSDRGRIPASVSAAYLEAQSAS